MKSKIFGLEITFETYEYYLQKIFNSDLRTFGCVNQYYLNLAYDDSFYTQLLQNLDLIHPDGMGVMLAHLILYPENKPHIKITGSDLYIKILERINKEEKSLYIFGDSQKVVERCHSEIVSNYPNIKVTGFHHGYIDINDQKIIERISKIDPNIVFVGLGAKKQEEWIAKWRSRLPNTKLIAVGGGLKVLSRERSRGPRWMQQIGLEWFIRLLNNPNEFWKRYIIGIPIFLFRIIVLKVKLTTK